LRPTRPNIRRSVLICASNPSEVARIHGTSGTSGRPTAFAWTPGDTERIAEAHARIMWSMGLRPSDTVFIGSILSLYVGSWGALARHRTLGRDRFSLWSGRPRADATGRRLAAADAPTAFYGTPSYALRLAEAARSQNVDPASLGLRVMFFSGEPGAGIPATKRLIEATFGAICIDSGSMGEMTPWMNLAECEQRTGMHLWQDIVYAEMLDPQTWQPVLAGTSGTPVYTHLERHCQPMIRLVSGDVAEWTDAPCPCGRTYPRLPRGIVGRIDDMIVIRGENVYPSAIEDVLHSFPELDSEFEVVLTRVNHMDELTVRVETAEAAAAGLAERVAAAIRRTLGVRPVLELCPPQSLRRTDLKSRRVRDERGV
jgi:phenylacetate-CoA ligase